MLNISENSFIISITENDTIDLKMNMNVIFIELDWIFIQDKISLFSKFSQSIWFPEYFWNNWDAFGDVMTDSFFVNKDIIITIKNIDSLLSSSNEDKRIFSDILLDLINSSLIKTKIQIYTIKNIVN